MVLILRQKQADGSFRMIEAPVEDPDMTIKLEAPQSAKPAAKKRFKCKVCSKQFAGQGVLSMHFSKNHTDLVEDKDTWRNYVETL
jgi:hypothetical protein